VQGMHTSSLLQHSVLLVGQFLDKGTDMKTTAPPQPTR
jgi:hypothetical protein